MKLVTASLLAMSLTGCGLASTSPFSKGSINISADAEGMRAFNDGLNALITNGKASPNKATNAWQHRRMEEAEITKRELKPSFLDTLFAGELRENN